MAQGTKITLSEAELQAMLHPDFFYIKHSAMNKVMEVLGETERTLRSIILTRPGLKNHTDTENPKIFRGENYRQLPYMVLDFPRRFSTEDIFAYRTMFWWGKEFSFTLHLQGRSMSLFKKILGERLGSLAGENHFLCVNNTPWQYHFEEDNYRPLEEILLNAKELNGLFEKDFIKISRKLPIQKIREVPEYAASTLKQLLELVF